MSISAITVFTLIVCRVRAHIVVDNENYRLASKSQPTYNDLSGEDTLVDPSHQEYVEKAAENTVKIDRDDLALSPARPPSFPLSSTSFHTTNFGTPSPTFVHGNVAGGSFPSAGHSGNGGIYFTQQNPFPVTFSNGGGSFGDYGGGGDGGYHNNLAPIIHKSVYVHVAPPEDDVPQQRVIVPKVPPRKNYQIVFIKAPTPPPPVAPVIPSFPQQSDKTLIYVLHPKPEEAPPIYIPPPPQNNPVKPEVYFIRYKTNKDNSQGGGGGGYHRRYGRDEEEIEGESLETSDTTSKPLQPESEVPAEQYDGQNNDSSGESSNFIYVFTTERGINAH